MVEKWENDIADAMDLIFNPKPKRGLSMQQRILMQDFFYGTYEWFVNHDCEGSDREGDN